MKTLAALLPLLAALSPILAADGGGEAYLECPDSEVTTHLLSLIDVLYDNGLTIFEELLAQISETDAGYTLLSGWATAPFLTILAPTDAAFQQAGIWGPFEHQSESQMVDLVASHTLQGQYTWDKLPKAPLHGIASTQLRLPFSNATGEGAGGWQSMVMVQDTDNAVVVKTAYGNATTWNAALTVSGTALKNIAILPVDNIIGASPKLSDALRMGMTTRSPDGLNKVQKALEAGAVDPTALDNAPGGATIFAPVDDAWDADIVAMLSDKTKASKLIGNHYLTGEIIFSPTWFNTGSYPSLKVASGAELSLTYNGTGDYVTLGDQTATILRSDVTLDNGVMHIIDKVLFSSAPAALNTTTNPNSTVGGGPPGVLAIGNTTKASTPTVASATAVAPSGSASGRVDQGQGKQSSGTGPSVIASSGALFLCAVAGIFVVV